jgi:glycosyltransferase involved in cell wall biosynthesis
MSHTRRGNRRRSAAAKSVVMTTRYPLDHPGGVERVARALVDCVGRSENDWKVSHVAAYPGRVGAARIPFVGDLVAAVRLATRVFGKGDVLLIHGAEYAWAALVVGRITGRPVVAVWHGVRASESLPLAKRRLGKAAQGWFLRGQALLQGVALRADATVAVSPTVAMDLRSRYGFRGEITAIPNGVAARTGRPREEARGSASSIDDPLRVIWVGTSGYRKGLDLALGACELARARGQNVSLTAVGVPLESAGLERVPVGPWLTGLGSVPPGEMEALYRRHDVMLFPTRYEACPMVVLEALAEGLPVIGSSVLQWLVEGAGEVIAGEDTSAYADALRALADPVRRRRLAGVAIERARGFSWESSAAGYLEVLNDVAKLSGRQRRNREKHRLPAHSGAE